MPNNCTEFQQQLQEAVELQTQLPPKLLQAHLASCPSCAELMNDSLLIEQSLPAWLSEIPPVDLSESIVTAWQTECKTTHEFQTTQQPAKEPQADFSEIASHKKRAKKTRILTAVFLVAVCFIAMFPLMHERFIPEKPLAKNDPTKSSPTKQPAITDTPKNQPKNNDQNIVKKNNNRDNGVALNAKIAYLKLAMSMQSTLGNAVTLLSASQLSGSQFPNATPKKPTHVPPHEKNEWEQRIKPIGKNVGKAFHFLLDAIPKNELVPDKTSTTTTL